MAEAVDVVVFQGIRHHRILDAINVRRGMGRLTVYDLDDDLWSIHPDSAAYSFYAQPGMSPAIETATEDCDLVMTLFLA